MLPIVYTSGILWYTTSMSKQIKVDDDVYDRLKQEAEENYRTIGGQIQYYMSQAVLSQIPQTFVPKAPNPETGYPCCEGKSPCKHWQWDSVSGEGYINILTGKRREV